MATPTRHPARIEGELDPGLSRWLWLVKWFLAIPHYIVLFFLWVAFFLVSVVAFFAILFTTRYPRSLFEFNLGVLRWTCTGCSTHRPFDGYLRSPRLKPSSQWCGRAYPKASAASRASPPPRDVSHCTMMQAGASLFPALPPVNLRTQLG